MGTTGLVGFYYKTKYYVMYNHSDSCPEYLGVKIVSEIQDAIQSKEIQTWPDRILKLMEVNENINPTITDIINLKKYIDLNVSRCSTNDWYCLTKGCQGSLKSILESGYIYNYTDECGIPHFQDFAYVLNFDSIMLDYYEDCDIVKSFHLDRLPDFKILK